MNIGDQIKWYRHHKGYSQEHLAEKMYVSRQTVSNWENSRSYPDLHNVMMLSVMLDVSLDELVKGDITMMENKLAQQQKEFKKVTLLMYIPMLIAAFVLYPLQLYLGLWGWVIAFVIYMFGIAMSSKVEQFKGKHDITTYKEITNFMNGETVQNEKRTIIKKVFEGTIVFIIFIAPLIIVFLISYFIFSLV